MPEGWAWCRFSDASINRDSERKPANSNDRKLLKRLYDYYGAAGVIDKVENYIFDEKLLLIGEGGANLLSLWISNHLQMNLS